MGQIIKKIGLIIDYCFLAFVIIWSGSSVAYGTFNIWPYVMTIVAGIVSLWTGVKFDKNTWLVIGLFAIVTLAQMVKFGGGITSIASPILGIVAIALIANIIRSDFSQIFIRIVAFFAIISLVFWFIDLFPDGHYKLLEIGKKLPQLGAENFEKNEDCAWNIYQHYTLYFYNVCEVTNDDIYQWVRNSGPFYEPGRFTIVLTLAMAIILFNNDFHKNKFLFFVVFAANISTFSTTGYLAMFVLFVCFFLPRYRATPIRFIIITILLVIVSYYVFQTDFVREKLATEMENYDIANSRFGAMIYHWDQIVKSPIIGFGNYLGSALGATELSPCGVTEMMRHWGIPLFVFCVFQIYLSAKSLLNNNIFFSISFTLIMLILAYSQTIMSAPLYYLFYLLGGKTNLNNDGKKI